MRVIKQRIPDWNIERNQGNSYSFIKILSGWWHYSKRKKCIKSIRSYKTFNYKYICSAYDDKYTDFNRIYKHVDLSLVDNGEFLPKLLEARKDAVALMLDARKSDLLITPDDEASADEAFEKYEKAFIKYSFLYELISSSYKKLENLRKKAVLKNYLAIGGLIIGILGIVLGLLF